jgi:hypothetical protein
VIGNVDGSERTLRLGWVLEVGVAMSVMHGLIFLISFGVGGCKQ